MQRVWSHAVTLLLGITLAVGFYEGRRLVTNTLRALQVGETSSGLASRLEPDALDAAARREEKRGGRAAVRAARPGATTLPVEPDRLTPASKSRHRTRPLEPGEPLDRLDAARGGDIPMALPVVPAEDTGEPLP